MILRTSVGISRYSCYKGIDVSLSKYELLYSMNDVSSTLIPSFVTYPIAGEKE